MHHKEIEYLDKSAVRNVYIDKVNSPDHYNKYGIEAITAIKASMSDLEFQGYLKGNIEKYTWRFRYKNGLEDLKKAQWYLNRLIQEIENDKTSK